MSRSYFHRRHRRDYKTPPYWIRLVAQKPERRAVNVGLHKVNQGADPDSVDLKPRKFRLLDYWR